MTTPAVLPANPIVDIPWRIGHGFDVHAFMPGDHLMMGGIQIPFEWAFKAHSDGDVLIHALCDALLGAAALGDIGQHFPDTDPAFCGIDSSLLLAQVHQLILDKQWIIGNVDITIIAQAPRMAQHIPAMRARLAGVLKIVPEQINIKATTTERLGFTGRGEGIAVEAVALIARPVV
ncbi:MAG: 2-C-methyl-D-erythritol 2,4-cyclodiphosphate synthase [Halothiobacillus sp. 24-54-40]|jgi:2-C-methyl-D-erythritol 2,4-cyclodiphosphate synthase|nr:MAG: 2-C-methyl-D-erythritol 2,4-cyclodiphosphate synthase [Halothiobacillus sp. 35-54-62]OYZ88123.1 MAG: 2-C-methyl-D-erythritol 2,4-cyclodiphosphate synthase [Halothiobacillus sp. 24-54-40]OZA81611.1 MAG: 2-C-methyl-D-erythritol 2,4-cyclodiphosphate synthase [Halothiobacillus sp. 39-53-45]HQS02235.1 2-C-methyl-D-erythritol 2,4-cyclodiphosphate synthase [Halothiobacillus sp.]HQS29138.1 2-C-methyl-D-erythritol 2,4-cyclodiphosphate synthase [Halothiobacillus sp.]